MNPTQDLVGQTIGEKYEVAAPIAAGSMGSIWVVRDPAVQGWLALKTIATNETEYDAPERFLREIESLERVVHPNVVQLVDYGFDEGLGSFFMVMEMVHGDPVSRLVDVGRLSEELAVHIGRGVCAALVSAHAAGVVHRDIKPANLMVRPRNDSTIEVKVLDFGLAFLRGEETRLTRKGTTPGTVLYSSPEQLRGEETDGRADLYSLGIVLYEMVAGEPPFNSRNIVEVAQAQMTKKPPKLRRKAKHVSRGYAKIVARLLEKNAVDRPVSAAAVEEMLAALQTGVPTAEHRGPARDVTAEWGLLS